MALEPDSSEAACAGRAEVLQLHFSTDGDVELSFFLLLSIPIENSSLCSWIIYATEH
jgi:hypothetical protein